LEIGKERGRTSGSLNCSLFTQGEEEGVIASPVISQRKLPGKVPNYPAQFCQLLKDFLPPTLWN
jgi:hypothetical protein